MPTKAKQYVGLVIGAGMFVFAASFAGGTLPDLKRFLMYLALAVLASLLKVRLPGITGSYSLNFLFLLAGVAYFTLPETLVTGCAAAFVQSVFNARKRPTAAQILFNMANLVLSIGVCFHIAHGPLAHGLESYRPAVMALVACLYFVINTVLVSGVLSLLEGKSLREVCQQWYLWSFPYYLVGATLIGQLPSAVHPVTPESWLMMLPPLYLIHFYYGLSKGTRPGYDCPEAEQCDPSLSVGAKLYLALITASGMLLLTFAGLYWHSDDRARFVGYLVVAILASACKIRLPGMTSTMSISFVVLLAAIVQLSIPETVIIAAVEAVVQCMWRPKRRPQSMQVFFNVAALSLSSALACFGCRLLQSTLFADSLAVNLLVATAVCYLANTIAVSTALCLVERKPASAIFAPCYFWSFPYYLVGASAAGLMVATSRAASWQPSLLALPLMALVFISYRLHVTRAVAPR